MKTKQLRDYEKYHWTKQTHNGISWKEHAKSLDSSKYYTKKEYMKFIHNQLSFGSINFESNNTYPYSKMKNNVLQITHNKTTSYAVTK